MGNKNFTQNPHPWLIRPPDQIKKQFNRQPNFIWISQNIDQQSKRNYLKNLNTIHKTKICESIQNAEEIIRKQKQQLYKVIVPAQIAESTCKLLFKYSYLLVSQKLQQKYKKITIISSNLGDFLSKIQIQSRKQRKVKQIPQFALIDSMKMHHLKINLYGLILISSNNQKAKSDFINLAQYFYQNQKTVNIKQFKEMPINPKPEQIIKWYTKQSFFSKLVNNIIKFTNDPLQIAYLRWPFSQMFKSIKSIYKTQSIKGFQGYKGAYLTEQELMFMKENKGRLIQILGFMSCNKNRQIAELFIVNTLFIIKVQQKYEQIEPDYGYIDLSSFSDYPEQKQILFNAFSIFKISQIEYKNNLVIIKLEYGKFNKMYKMHQQKSNLSLEESKYIQTYLKHKQILKVIYTQGNIFNICQLYDQSIKYYEMYKQLLISQKITSGKLIRDIYYELAQNYTANTRYEKALFYHLKNLELTIDELGNNHPQIPILYNNIGFVYKKNGQYQKALEFYKKSLEQNLKKSSDNHVEISGCYFNIGQVYKSQKQYQLAIQYHLKSLNLRLNIKNTNKNEVIRSYDRLAEIYKNMNNDAEALVCLYKGLKIKLEIFEQNHKSIANSYYNIAQIYKNNEKALQYHLKSLKIRLKLQLKQQLIYSYFKIAELYKNKGDYLACIDYYVNCLILDIELNGQNHESVASTYYNIGYAFRANKSFEKAYGAFKSCYEIRAKLFGQDNNETINARAMMKNCKNKI